MLILKRRRDQLKEDFEEDDTTKEDFSSSMRSRMASMAAAQTAVPSTDTGQSVSVDAESDLTYENIDAYSEIEEQDEVFDKEEISYEEDERVEKYGSNLASISESRVEDELLPDNSQQDVEVDLKENFEEDYSQFIDSSQTGGPAEFANEIDFDLSDEIDKGKRI